MKIGLIDVDGHNYPNIPLMKISAWHKAQEGALRMANSGSEREEIIQSLSQRERKILFDYEKEHGRLFPGAIYKVIQDQKDLAKEKANQKKRRKRR